jgi:hypothetical protein
MAKVGRPTKYTIDHAAQAENFALIGFDDIRMADAFGVSVATITKWKKDHPEFSAAIKNGKDVADGKVGISLYKQATGFVGPDGKYYPPNPTACIFWLKNRQKAQWRDKHEVEHSGQIAYKDLTDDELNHKISQLEKALKD